MNCFQNFLSFMILYNHPSYFKSGEINSCGLSPLPTLSPIVHLWGIQYPPPQKKKHSDYRPGQLDAFISLVELCPPESKLLPHHP